MKLINNSIYLTIRLFYTYIPSCRSVVPDLKNFGLMTPSSSIRFIFRTGSYKPAADISPTRRQTRIKKEEDVMYMYVGKNHVISTHTIYIHVLMGIVNFLLRYFYF